MWILRFCRFSFNQRTIFLLRYLGTLRFGIVRIFFLKLFQKLTLFIFKRICSFTLQLSRSRLRILISILSGCFFSSLLSFTWFNILVRSYRWLCCCNEARFRFSICKCWLVFILLDFPHFQNFLGIFVAECLLTVAKF